MPSQALAAHRLTLSAQEWSVLCTKAELPQPPGFDSQVPDDGTPATQEATDALFERGVLTGDEREPTASVAANLAVIVGGQVVVDVVMSVRHLGLRARFAITGELGASLLTLPDQAVELSMFPAASIGRELVRAVPGTDELARASDPVRAALAGPGTPPYGRLPLAALAEYGPAQRTTGTQGTAAVADRWGLTDVQRRLAGRLDSEVMGVLRAVVTGPARGAVAVAQIIWLATADGWLATHPVTAADGTREVVIEPVQRTDFASAVAPYLAELIGNNDD
ncbi:ESX secretion-associated protein EspG [Micromonospora sp. NPDC049044]|uniref:ESX secretion-associated protein EspG n=1 Tax=unclassified Micromonospora TaxID=2617518 RepID=UPI0033ED056B